MTEERLAFQQQARDFTTKEVLPVTVIDGQAVGTGQPGPVYARLHAGYQQAKAQALAYADS